MVEGVTIKLGVKPKSDEESGQTYEEGTSSGRITIKVTRSSFPPGVGSTANFYEYKHEENTGGGKELTVKRVLDDSGKEINTSRLKGVPKVTSISSYCWKHGGKVLLVSITTNDKVTKYYVRSSGNPQWYSINGGSQPIQLQPEVLEQKLDQQNCYFNKLITMNLTKDVYVAGKRYCCYNHIGQGKVTVTPAPISCNQHPGSSHLTYYKHEVNYAGGVQLAGIEYYKNGNPSRRKKITIPNLNLPAKDSVKVYTFYCDNGKDPVLIYVEFTGGSGVTGWFKKGSGTDAWERISSDLNGITPETINNCNSGGWTKLKSALKGVSCTDYEACKTTPKVPSTTIPVPPVSLGALTEEAVEKYWKIILSSVVPGATPIIIDASHSSAALIKTLSKPAGPSKEAIIGGSVGGVLGTGALGLGIWKGPALLARLITRL
ncbi:hypothetical protein BEWA_049380 [Theileria equi strain WA]|uniref:Uncharacterized protein n=1 Tax=Theileria equi strain WA TaxID=1537102 RepID=L1LAW5_THEEQ|nr:hypothetical protein BEWA_049380 [Theileria equi strain WA]EKX72471.1 hypothetical protein BEWA_049380 [Theileria equi strain WA]|eukprot:XP_004831923.1 hypothetical protein BEWA_049380 [Theileria equi strain WA]